MRLDALLAEPTAGLIHLERWCNDGSPSGMSFGTHQVSEAYRPREGKEKFPLRTRIVPWDQLDLYAAQPSNALVGHVYRPDGVLVALHPDDPTELPGARGPDLMAAPTSSARTVLVLEPGPAWYAKLHYPAMIGRAPRHLNRKRVWASVRMCAELNAMAAAGRLTPTSGYLAESLGVASAAGGEEMGVLYREYAPYPEPAADPAVIPVFALFSTDLYAPDDPPLLAQLLDGVADPADAFRRTVLEPILESHLSLTLGLGLVPEDHAQNVLVELAPGSAGPAATIRRAVRRDMLDWYGDLGIRRERGLAPELVRTFDVAADPDRSYGGRSYAFDFRLGDYILDPLIDCAQRCAGVPAEESREWVRLRVHELAAGHGVDLRDYFQPYDQVYYYERSTAIWRDGRPVFRTRTGPRYR